MKRMTLALTIAITLALGGAGAAYTPTPEQCAAAGGFFNPATQGCTTGAVPGPVAYTGIPGVLFILQPGDSVSYGGTTVYNRNDSPIGVRFCPCPNWVGGNP